MNNLEIFKRLDKSQFRSKFHLNDKEIVYIKKLGIDKIQEHAKDFIAKRISPANISNDGKQTPFKGHPVFIAQHATATCCRGCIEKWHHIKKDHELTNKEKDYIIMIIMTWIKKELEQSKN